MKNKNDFVVRVAVGRVAGPHSAVFRIWSDFGESNVYASVRDLAGEIKISLHESGQCNAGLTSQFAAKDANAIAMMGGLRHQSQWTRLTHVGSRIVNPLQFAIPASELRMWRDTPVVTEKVTWLESPGEGRSIIISCIFSGQSLPDDQWPGRRNGTNLFGTKLLPNGEKFWLIWQDCLTGPIEQQIISEAQAHMKRQRPVRFSSITDDTPPAPRRLIFKEYPKDRLLVVLDAAAQCEVV